MRFRSPRSRASGRKADEAPSADAAADDEYWDEYDDYEDEYDDESDEYWDEYDDDLDEDDLDDYDEDDLDYDDEDDDDPAGPERGGRRRLLRRSRKTPRRGGRRGLRRRRESAEPVTAAVGDPAAINDPAAIGEPAGIDDPTAVGGAVETPRPRPAPRPTPAPPGKQPDGRRPGNDPAPARRRRPRLPVAAVRARTSAGWTSTRVGVRRGWTAIRSSSTAAVHFARTHWARPAYVYLGIVGGGLLVTLLLYWNSGFTYDECNYCGIPVLLTVSPWWLLILPFNVSQWPLLLPLFVLALFAGLNAELIDRYFKRPESPYPDWD